MPSKGFSTIGITDNAKRKLIRYKATLESRDGRIFTLSEVIETALDAAENQADTFAFLDNDEKASL